MNLVLKSDFRDYYDHMFDHSGTEFSRISTDGMNRVEIFRFLRNNGYETVENGFVEELARKYHKHQKAVEVVVYTALRAHAGSGKKRMHLNKAVQYHKGRYASVFHTTHSTSYRLLQIGHHMFWLKYHSRNDWRSNCGNVHIEILDNKYKEPRLCYPLYAIDFVDSYVPDDDFTQTHFLAIDFNIAPRIEGTGVEDLLSARQIVDLIKKAVV